MVPDIAGKRLEMLRELLPATRQVAVIWNGANPYPGLVLKNIQAAASPVGIDVQSLEIRSLDDLAAIVQKTRRTRPDALMVVEDPLTSGLEKNTRKICKALALDVRNRRPANR
jgi:putative tryptophan/tyrosine transport system substrate-binding protein